MWSSIDVPTGASTFHALAVVNFFAAVAVSPDSRAAIMCSKVTRDGRDHLGGDVPAQADAVK